MPNHIVSEEVLTYSASGKFMLFGEYLVLKGAKCLAIPLKFGQTLKITENESIDFTWESIANGKTWFSAKFNDKLKLIDTTNEETAQVLMKLMRLIQLEKPNLFEQTKDFVATADFDLKWGLGSSSTLISLLAQWSEVNPYHLLENTFGGSGYDIACATIDAPITYLTKGNELTITRLSPAITNKILFVYSGNKQNSKNEVKRFSQLDYSERDIEKMNHIIESIQTTNDIETFEAKMKESEALLSSILKKDPIQSSFKTYPYVIKSMGAWGGDFFMATYRDELEAKKYFENQGYTTFFSYSEIIKM